MGDRRLLAAEQAVRDAGVDWTIVRADWFDQNFDEGVLREPVLAGEIALPVGRLKQPFNDAGDVAAVAVAALTSDTHTGQTLEVGGPEALSFADVASLLSDATDRDVRFSGDADHYVEVMTGSGLDAGQVRAEVEAFAALAATGDAEATDLVERVTGRPPTSFADYARAAAARGAWTRS